MCEADIAGITQYHFKFSNLNYRRIFRGDGVPGCIVTEFYTEHFRGLYLYSNGILYSVIFMRLRGAWLRSKKFL